MNSEKIFDYIRDIELGGIPQLNSIDRKQLTKVFLQHGCIHYAQKIDKSINTSVEKKRTKNIYDSAQKVFSIINESKIPYAVLKGLVLSDIAYDDMYLRSSRDIDLLVSPKNLKEINKLLLSIDCHQGYIHNNRIEPVSREQKIFFLTNTHQTPPFFYYANNETQYIEFDINLRLTWSGCNCIIDVDDILKHSYYYNKEKYQIRTLEPLYFFVAMCLHHYKDMNSPYLLHRKKRISFRRYCDIYYFIIKNQDEITPQRLSKIGNELSVSPYIFYCLYQCFDIFRNDKLKSYLELLESKEGRELLDVFGLCDSEKTKWNITLSERIFTDSLCPYLEETLPPNVLESIFWNYKYL